MEKAFDTKDLLARLSTHLGPLSEEAAKAVTTEVFDWAIQSCEISGSSILQLVKPGLAILKPMALKAEDSIDGQ